MTGDMLQRHDPRNDSQSCRT